MSGSIRRGASRLAIGDTLPQRLLGGALRAHPVRARLERVVGEGAGDRRLSLPRLLAARLLASAAYYDELARAKRA